MPRKATATRIVKGIKYRTCSGCEVEKPLDEFKRDASKLDGHHYVCLECNAKRYRDRRASDGPPPNERKNTARADAAAEQVIASATRAAHKLAKEQAADLERAVAQRRRLASDHAALRPEDFAVGVANDDPNAPGVRALNKQAAAEKRQEFSQRMGDHMESVRKATVRTAQGTGDVLSNMPGETGEYIGALAEQERRFGNRRLARSISLFAAGEEQARRLFALAADQYLTGRIQATGYAKRPPSRPVKRSVCLLLSDLHIGSDLSGSEQPMPFRALEEARRLEYILRQAIDYKPQYRKDSELVLMLNGDLIDGLLMHDLRDGAPLIEQKVTFQRYFERFIAECARAYPSVRVFCQPGNHGRDLVRHPGRATSRKWDSHETEMYYALSRACTALKNVTFRLDFRAVTAIDLHGSWFGLTHGDTEVKLGDPDTKAKDNTAVLNRINATDLYGVHFAAWGFGHFHKPRYIPGNPRIIFNGALLPPNGYARTAGYIGESAGQFLWESVAGYPVGDVRFIQVGPAQDRDEALGRIIEPFRFNLDGDFPS